MKALMLTKYNNFEVQDAPMPKVGQYDVLVRVKACGVCGSDVHGMDGSSGRRIPPIIMGHEAAGEVETVGSKVTRVAPGDRITFDSTVYCGQCWHCRRGEINYCEDRRVLGVSCGDYRQHGAFAEYVSIPERICYRLPEGLSFKQAAFTEPVSIAVHAAGITPISLNDSAVVVGVGMIGLLVVQAARAKGCGTVIAVDLSDEKLELAKQLGADEGINASRDDIVEQIQSLTGGRGADVAFEAVGVEASVNTAIASVRKGGSVTLVGNLSPTIELPLQSVVTRGIQLIGSCASSGEYPACLDLISRGAIKVDPLMSAAAPLDEGGEWFKRLYEQEPGLMKVILQP